MTDAIHTHRFDNGLVLLAEKMDWLESVAFAVLMPAGYAHDSESQLGLANFTCEMVQRGCGPRDSRQFIEDLDRLGVDRSAAVTASHTSFGGATLAANLLPALKIYADLVQRPLTPGDQLEEGRQVCLQEIWALEDDLAQKTMLRLKAQHYGDPWGRSSQGREDHLESMTLDDVRKFVRQRYQPDQTILSVAGKFCWDELLDQVGEEFGNWSAGETTRPVESPAAGGYVHVPFDSNQTQIGVAYNSVPYSHPRYFQARGAVGVLSDGMSSRLFTEVREKRGLCYTVYASCHSLQDRGSVLCYSGTSTDRAQETLDVLLAELQRLPAGIEQDELNRLKARIKSSLMMQQESSASRCATIAGDWFHLKRVMSKDEVNQIIDNLTCESINQYLREFPPQDFTVVTLGEKELEVRLAVS